MIKKIKKRGTEVPLFDYCIVKKLFNHFILKLEYYYSPASSAPAFAIIASRSSPSATTNSPLAPGPAS